MKEQEKTSVEKDNKKKKYIAIIVEILVLLIILFIVFFVKKEYKITFNTNGGTELASVTVKEDSLIKQPEDPSKEGFVFAGWYYNDELFDFNTKVKIDMELEARWAVLGNAKVEGVTLKQTKLSLKPNGTAVLEAVITPEDVKDRGLTWSSSDESIVIVDEKGNVKAIKEGKVTITVKTADGGYTATCEVTVTKEEIKVTGVSISGAKTVTAGSSIKLTAKVSPDDATNKAVTWKSSNTSIATVDGSGNVKALKAGTVTITVTTKDGSKTATYTITVKAKTNDNKPTPTPTQKPTNKPTSTPTKAPTKQPTQEPTNKPTSAPSTIEPSSVSISGSKDMTVKDTGKLTATITPNNANSKTKLTWSSSNSSVVSVDQSGNITAVGAGSATITVTTENGKTASVTITVKEKYECSWVKIEESSADQYMLYIVNSKGQHVAGTVTITTIGGTSKTVSIPADGLMVVKSTIKSVSNIKAN